MRNSDDEDVDGDEGSDDDGDDRHADETTLLLHLVVTSYIDANIFEHFGWN